MPGQADALWVEDLTVVYEKFPALWNVSCHIPTGSMAAIIGPNGAGKSTFLKAIMNFIPESSGHVTFFGKGLPEVRSKIAYMPQRSSVLWDFPMTALELVLMGSYAHKGLFSFLSKKEKAAALEILEQVDMHTYAHAQIGALSPGQQQRLFVGRALFQNPDLYLMDEPFAGVDMATEARLFHIFHELQKKGKTLILVHHQLDSVEKHFDWVLLLNSSLITSGKTKEVYTEINLQRAYGKASYLLEEAINLSGAKNQGLK